MRRMMESIIQDTKECFLCGSTREYGWNALESHHCFGGSNRKYSEKYGLKVWLCGESCHRNGPKAVHQCKETADRIHEVGQRTFERDHTREEFMRIFGKNYL